MKKTRLESSKGFYRFLLPAFTIAVLVLLVSQKPSVERRLYCYLQVQQEEAVNVEFARILLRGDSLYPDISKGGPYIHCSYSPLFPWLQSLLMKWDDKWKKSVMVLKSPLPNPYSFGRRLAFAGFLGCGFLLAYTAWRRWKNPYWIFLLPALLWLSPTWELWGTMVRLDTCLHFLNMASFLLLWKACEPFHPEWKQPTGPSLALAGFLNAAAILMKPTALTVTLAFALYAFLRRMKREALIFFSCALLPVAVFLLAAQVRTHGLYWTHTVKWAAVGFHPDQLLQFLGRGLAPEAGWLAAGVALTLWMKRFSLLLKCQLLFSVLSLWTLSREGAAENYFMEFIWTGLLVIGEGWAGCKLTQTFPSFEKGRWGGIIRWVPVFILLAGLFSFSRYPSPRIPSNDEMEAKTKMLEHYPGDGWMNFGEPFALDTDLPVMAGKKIWYQHSGILAIEKAGLWDPAPLLNDIRNKKFSTIELYDLPKQYLVSQRVEDEIRGNYKVAVRQYGRIWLIPKQP